MSNAPDSDPVAHAAKFIAIFAAIPAILGGVIAAMPTMSGPRPPLATLLAGPVVTVVVMLAVAYGVHRRSIAAAWAGIVVFSLLMIGMVVGSIAGGKAGPATLLWVLMLAWPIKKLWSAKNALAIPS